MKSHFARSFASVAWLAAVLSFGVAAADAAEPKSRGLKPGEFNPAHETVDVFQAIESGKIEARVIPKDITGGKILFTNKTAAPLNVKIPDAFATVHVLAQGVGSIGGIGGGQAGGATGGAGLGGGGGGAGGAGGGNFFNVAPEKVGEMPYSNLCLEHGKPDPRSTMKYEMRPLETVTTKPGIRELTVAYGAKQVSYRVAQIVAWHLNNDMSWEELAAKRIERAGFGSEPYFTADEMRTAFQLTRQLAKYLEERNNATTETLALPKL